MYRDILSMKYKYVYVCYIEEVATYSVYIHSSYWEAKEMWQN